MQVLFDSSDRDGAHSRESTLQQVRLATRRLSWLVAGVKVRLSSVATARGRVGRRCEIELQAHRAGRVVITSVARDSRSALDAALRRAARVLVQVWRQRLGPDPMRCRAIVVEH